MCNLSDRHSKVSCMCFPFEAGTSMGGDGGADPSLVAGLGGGHGALVGRAGFPCCLWGLAKMQRQPVFLVGHTTSAKRFYEISEWCLPGPILARYRWTTQWLPAVTSPQEASQLVRSLAEASLVSLFSSPVVHVLFTPKILWLRLSESVYKSFKDEFLFVETLYLSWVYSLLIFKGRRFRGLSFLCKIWGLGCLIWSLNPFTSHERSLLVVPLNCGWLQLEYMLGPDEPSSLPLLLVSRCCFFTPCCGGSVYQFSCVFWEDFYSKNTVADLLCPWEEVSSGSSCTTILESSLLSKTVLT